MLPVVLFLGYSGLRERRLRKDTGGERLLEVYLDKGDEAALNTTFRDLITQLDSVKNDPPGSLSSGVI